MNGHAETRRAAQRLQRREFLGWSGLAASGAWYLALVAAAESSGLAAPAGDELTTDVLIVGGGLGGCAAALAATRAGARVVLTEPTDWIGGQITQQAVPTDDHRWIESCGCTRSYRELRHRIRSYYRQHYSLTDEAKARPHLNPGGPGPVSPLAHEPKVCLAVLQEMLAPAVQTGQLRLLLNATTTAADVAGDRVHAVRLINTRENRHVCIQAKYFVDASETGELLPLTGTEFVTGSESQAQTGEPHASAEPRPANMQAVTWCYAVDYLENEDHTIDKPLQYDFWRQYRPQLTPPWPEPPFLSLWYSSPSTLRPVELSFVPTAGRYAGHKTPTLNLWLYRRILNLANFQPGAFPSDITIINWPQNDYLLGNPFGGTQEENARHLEGAKQLSLSLLYWLQTEAPRPDGKVGWRGLRLRPDVLGTEDGFAKFPYIRESRRILAELTILEQHVREPAAQRVGRHQVAPLFADSVGVGSYGMDLHPTTGGDNYFHVNAYPYQIPLGALIPRRMENLVAGCKNLGTTHLSNGAYRLHPTEWNIGESAGALVAFCLEKQEPPRHIRHSEPFLREFQARLAKAGVELDWARLAQT
jgi:hypothetical protein